MKRRKKLTPEQEAKRDERKARFQEHIKALAAMSDDDRGALMERIGAVVTCEGHPLSPKNCMLLALQNPRASVVGGFRQWIKAGRVVRKGEHGSAIFFPKGAGKESEADQAAAAEGLTKVENGPRFLVGTVFDITQTDELADPAAESEAA